MYQHLTLSDLNEQQVMDADAVLNVAGEDLSLELVDGFFCCLIIGPKKVAFNEAFHVLSAALKSDRLSLTQRESLTLACDRLWQQRVLQLLGDETLDSTIWMPLLCEQQDYVLSGKQWAEGFMLGTNLHADYWKAASEKVEAIDDCAVLLSALISNEGDDGQLTQSIRQQLLDSLPIAVQTMAMYWQPWREQRTVVKGIQVGRNDPCHCGSGKKYKKCCGAATVH